MTAKPRIGIPMGSKESTFSRHPHYSMETLYFDAISKVGGVPVPLIYNEEHYEEYLDMVDGILVPGGSFASPTEWYEENDIELGEAGSWSGFFKKITKTAIENNIPVLGLCAGMQFMAGVTGSKMTVNVTKKLNTKIDHLNGADKEYICHDVIVEEGSCLHGITGLTKFGVNSAHLEAVTTVGEGVIVSAKSEDGCIEAIELLNHPFAVGVQWHPEFFCDDPENPHFKIMKALIDAAKTNRI